MRTQHHRTATGLIAAAGRGVRMGTGVPKVLLRTGDRPLLAHTLRAFEESDAIDGVILMVAEEILGAVAEEVVDAFKIRKVSKILPGGPTRQESVWAGLQAIDPGCQVVAIHDGARPLVTADLIGQVVEQAARHGAAALAVRPIDTIRRGEEEFFQVTLDREKLWMMQTPQAFSYGLIVSAHRQAIEHGYRGTDDVSLVEAMGRAVRVVEGRHDNFKVTSPEDLVLVEALLAERNKR